MSQPHRAAMRKTANTGGVPRSSSSRPPSAVARSRASASPRPVLPALLTLRAKIR